MEMYEEISLEIVYIWYDHWNLKSHNPSKKNFSQLTQKKEKEGEVICQIQWVLNWQLDCPTHLQNSWNKIPMESYINPEDQIIQSSLLHYINIPQSSHFNGFGG